MTLEARIAGLLSMSVAQKKAEWRRLRGVPAPPAFGVGLLTRAIAHAMQEKAAGGSDKAMERRIAQLTAKASGKKTRKAPVVLRPGTWLSRTWHGTTHQVIVLETGFEYRGERYVSLTAIAQRITGARWSGPRFFGLASPRLDKMGVTGNG